EYIRKLDADEFVARARPFFTHAETEAVVRPLAELVRDRVRLLSEVEPMVDFLLSDDITYDEASWRHHVAKHGERSVAMLVDAVQRLEACEWRAAPPAAARAAAAEAG